MSAQTFHRFLELPCELRHLIWEASCFNRHEKRHGIHYVDCPGPLNYWTSIECRAASETGTSACLMDAGLRAACRESRRVIQNRMRQHGFLNTDPSVENKSLCLKNPEPATLIIDRIMDIVCFRISDWFKVQRWTPQFYFYLSHAASTGKSFHESVAFEIDGSWDPKHSIWQTMRLAIRFYDPQGWYPLLDILVIDKDIHWFRDDSIFDITYADCDNEFMVAGWENLCHCDQKGTWSGALAFLVYVSQAYQLYAYINGRRERRGLSQTNYTRKVNILVRRDNEVMPCQSCQTGAKNDRHFNYLLDGLDLPTIERDEKVEESKEEEQEHDR